MGELNVKHHALIQALLSRGPLLEKEFHSIFFTLTGKNPGSHHQLFNEYLRKINKELAYVQFELRGCRNQYDGKVYYGVVNNVADEQSKFGTKYSVAQIAFYKAVIEAIVHDPTAQGSISNIEALNLRLEDQGLEGGQSNVPPAFKNFSISQKEKSLHDFIRDRWLCSTPSGHIGLGVRSFLDLRSWFRSNDVSSCDICNEAGVKADLCSNEGCTIRIHGYCLKKKFSQTRVEIACPGCGTKWQCPNLSEEEENEGNLPTQSQGPSSSARPIIARKLRSSKIEQVTLSEAAPRLTVKPDPDLPKRTRRSSRLI